ncbi:hypothetical protein KFK09_024973 [Dendrobium nobile]|uniref:Uncharacterized protein n=1 Tax=Dendrobium nobile TaxID=94219 RepID=A0A8T3AF91_DENNO|nr:hypothetical protein KFK09_024973 [Dendrobium nobile]
MRKCSFIHFINFEMDSNFERFPERKQYIVDSLVVAVIVDGTNAASFIMMPFVVLLL